MCFDIIDCPDNAVSPELFDICSGKMECYKRGICPVEKSCGKSVVLRNRKPVPYGITLNDIAMGILSEIPEKMPFKIGKSAAQAYQSCFEPVLGIGKAAKSVTGAKAA